MLEKNFIKNFLEKIKHADQIAIFCHRQPDFDALGTAYAMYQWLVDNFGKEDKRIYLMVPDDALKSQDEILFPPLDKLATSKELSNALGIILDTANESRVLTSLHTACKELIAIDHHPRSERFTQLEFIDPTYPATAQILAELFEWLEEKENYIFRSVVAQYLYAGIITDTNNMLSPAVLPSTFEVMGRLVLRGINRNLVHDAIFMQNLTQKKFSGHVIEQIKITKNGLAYAIISKKDSQKYMVEDIPTIVPILANIHNVEIWTSLMYDFEFKKWKASIRSRDVQINAIAREFGGGGHKKSAATVFEKKRDYFKLLARLNQYLYELGYKNTSINEANASSGYLMWHQWFSFPFEKKKKKYEEK
ncbi:phosphoesterase RecJ-like protein [Mycoplasmoides fastidiosum]|uniref:Phosphoesterase RecJ-like protein n=1 Tax=Mycoplasmoides fastidiosum TaxID=92758 RepID=A0ABU0M059_9BACT|nr:bifunctional oligoribonuclease/PAP phosphatase NrnA [Mycoplasmoides fastidiosum]MDQ0514346.1 phosphoesterase RecJ-like protein [Mycoplasmoides fastidiosum]UUD38052.1 bifunctional oligoribonuclease/PAP phosphatase NrnA [Mycoplasmoides fastidiosum]